MMDNFFDTYFNDDDIINNDVILSICIDIILRNYTKHNKDKVRERLQEIFIVSRSTDYISLKDALWISETFKLFLFATLCRYSSKYLYEPTIEKGLRKVFGRRTKNKEHHMNFQNFRLLFIHCVLLWIREEQNHSV